MAGFKTGLFLMSRYHSYIKSATTLIDSYKGEQPFAIFIKKYFAANKRMGSRDRKMIAAICYSYFRVKHLLKEETSPSGLVSAVFLCHESDNALLADLNPALNEKITLPPAEKLLYLGYELEDIFPFSFALSQQIKRPDFFASFLQQPLLYLRARPGMVKTVKAKLENAGVAFQMFNQDCLGLPNGTTVDSILQLDKEAVIQDLSSQKVFDGTNLMDMNVALQKNYTVWDACAASGGKSILWYDKIGNDVELTVSDVRKSILENLATRFNKAGIKNYRSFLADLTKDSLPGKQFDVIICDAPCTGSGTWSRTPEQLAYFKSSAIAEYQKKQKKIAVNAAKSLNDKGLFLYITCSVFEAENETVVEYLVNNTRLRLLHQQYLEGYDKLADTLFVAIFSN